MSVRIGFLYDGNPNTETMAASYEPDDEMGVRLTVPFRIGSDHQDDWWLSGISADDPHRQNRDYDPPNEMTYQDSSGSVGLVGCRAGRSSRNLGSGFGHGVILARFAVEGAREGTHFRKINGFQSEIDGLASWLQLSTHTTTASFPREGDSRWVATKMEAVPDVPLTRVMNLSAMGIGQVPAITSSEVTYRSRALIRTLKSRECDWESHLSIHVSMRNLLRIASWKRLNFVSHEAYNSREKGLLSSGKSAPKWNTVRTALSGLGKPTWRERDMFLFNYGHIGSTGVGKWLSLSKKYARGLDPFVSLLGLEGATIDAGVAQLGIALEALGYKALQEHGLSKSRANDKPVSERIAFLLEDTSEVLDFDTASFAADFANSYNSVKHANHPEVDREAKQEHFFQGVELVRKWIALRLGVPASVLKNRN